MKRPADLTVWEFIKSLCGWQPKCECGRVAFWGHYTTGARKCTPCAELHIRGFNTPEAFELQSQNEKALI